MAAHNERMLGSNGTVQIIRDIPVQNLSDTDSSECEFVLERKPPHLRTPEMVSLNSESDSDVVFINEEKGTPAKREIPPPGVFEQTKNSSDTSDSDDNKNLTVLRMKWSAGGGFREVKPGTSNEPVPSTSTGGFTGSLGVRQPIRLKLKKRVIKSIYESTSESESDSKDNNTPDNTLIPTVQYSSSTSEDEENIDVVGDTNPEQTSFKRKFPIFNEDSKSDTTTQTNPRKRRRMTKQRKPRTPKADLSSPKHKKLKSVIVKHSSKGNGFYVATEKKSGTESSSSSSNNGSCSDESSDDESNSMSDDNKVGDSPGWSSTASE